MRSFISKLCTLLMVSMLVFSTGTMEASAAENTVNVQLTVDYGQSEARTVTDMVNEFRGSDQAWYWNADNTTKTNLQGELGNLTYDATLERIAMKRAAELALSYEHTRANGEGCFTAFDEYGYSGSTMGENIAAGYGSAEAVFVGWREDDDDYSGQGHRRNMLNTSFNAIGMGHVFYNGTHYWAMELGVVNSEGNSGVDGTQTVDIETSNSYIQSLSTEENITVALGSTSDLPTVNAVIESNDTWVQIGNGSPIGIITNPNWAAGDSSIASISDGKVTGLSIGTTTLTVTAGNASTTVTLEVTSDGQGDNTNQPDDGNDGDITTPDDGNDEDITTPDDGNDEDITTPDDGNDEDITTPDDGNDEDITTPDDGNDEDITTPDDGNDGDVTLPDDEDNNDFTDSDNNNSSGTHKNESNDEEGSSSEDAEEDGAAANAVHSIVIPVTSSVDGVKTSTEGIYLSTNCRGTVVLTPKADISASYALAGDEKPYSKFYNFDAKKSKLAKAAIDSSAAELKATVGPMLNIELGKMSKGKYSLLPSDGAAIRIVLGIPKSFAEPNKTFAVICVRNGGVTTVLNDVDTCADTITFDTTGGSGVYTIVKY